MRDITIVLGCKEFRNFIICNKDYLKKNSITVAHSNNCAIDGLKMVVDYDDDHYSIRIEDFETSDISFEHLYDDQIELAEVFYDALLLRLIKAIKPRSEETELTVKTPLGNLVAKSSGDFPEYQGFSIYIEDEIVAAVEHEKDKGLRVFTYGDLTDDEPTHIEKVENIEMQLHILNSDTNI